MRQAVLAAAATLLAAVGLAAGSAELAGDRGPVLLAREPRVPLEPATSPEEIILVPLIDSRPTQALEHPALVITYEVPVEEPELEAAAAPAASEAPEAGVAPPADTGMGEGVEQWRPLVTEVFGADAADTALCLMVHESGGNPNATNSSSGAAGLMQVMPSWAPEFGVEPAALYDPVVNLQISKALYDDGGWSHWSPYNRGECH